MTWWQWPLLIVALVVVALIIVAFWVEWQDRRDAKKGDRL
jgi:uncharacterized membrane protein YsdA (DUF1294 family)